MRGSLFFALICTLTFVGCTSTGGARWYAPATWFSGREKKAVERTEEKVNTAREALLRAAQKTAHETQAAITFALPSRPVEVATEAAQQTTAALDQALGSLPTDELAALRARVAGLVSENEALRTEAEQARARERDTLGTLSQQLATTRADFAQAQRDLAAGFARENSLANEARAAHMLKWIGTAVAVLCGLAWLYLRFALGGIPSALGAGLRELRAAHPSIAAVATPILDSYLNRHEQRRIARHAA